MKGCVSVKCDIVTIIYIYYKMKYIFHIFIIENVCLFLQILNINTYFVFSNFSPRVFNQLYLYLSNG